MTQEQQQVDVIEERELVRSAFSMCIKNLRRNTGIAQERLAQECGIDRAYMGQLERGRHSPTLDTLLRLFPPLGITFTEFAQEYEMCLKRVSRSKKRSRKRA